MIYSSISKALLALQLAFLLGADVALAAQDATNSPTLVPPPSFTSESGSSTGTHSATTTRSLNPSGSGNSSTSASSTSTAQYPSLSGVPPCVSQCLETAISTSNCTSVIDVNCFCISGKFPKAIVSCVSTTCPTELNSTESLAQQFCNIASASPSLTFPLPTTSSTATSGSAIATVIPTTATSSPATSQTGGAMGRTRVESFGAVWAGVGVGIFGMLVGACCL